MEPSLWDGALEGEAVVQITGCGPSGTTALHPEEGRFITVPAVKKP
jgi:hypothetical protein